MIDFHSHILPNVDDGSTSMEETINLIKEASEAGFTDIICTSHYIEQYYECNAEERRLLLESAQMRTVPRCANLHLGSEIYITTEIIELIKNKQASTVNNSKYVLFELPLNAKPLFAKEIVYKLIENGYIPIIAHPERYSYVQENIEYIEELVEMGALLQSNFGSVIGLYGNKAQKTVKKLLKNDLVSFLGSDVHRVNTIYPKIPKILKKLSKIISKEKLEKITTLNAVKVLKNEDI